MILRAEQLAVFEADRRRRSCERLARRQRRLFPDACAELGPQGLDELVRFASDDAAALGLTSWRGAACYADLMFLLGPDFADQEAPWGILSDPARTEGDKIASLYACWKEA